MYDSDTYLSTISRENSVQLGTHCTTIKLRHLSFNFGFTRIPLTQLVACPIPRASTKKKET